MRNKLLQNKLQRINRKGFTMLEVMVAMFISSFIAMALLKALGAADSIHSRALIVSNSSILAENEIENIRKKASFNETVEDCTYVETMDKRDYRVKRTILIPESLQIEDKKASLYEVDITVEPVYQTKSTPIHFKFLQGTSW